MMNFKAATIVNALYILKMFRYISWPTKTKIVALFKTKCGNGYT